MKRIYSSVTGIYLGLIFERLGAWYSEDRVGKSMRHSSQVTALERLERQPEHHQNAA